MVKYEKRKTRNTIFTLARSQLRRDQEEEEKDREAAAPQAVEEEREVEEEATTELDTMGTRKQHY